MQISNLQSRKGEAGFTLVELAIVMIIIGLLIGGILKGQELIANAQVTATVAQIKGIDAAFSTFRDKYSVLPGDMTNGANRLRDCAGLCATGVPGGALGNGRVDVPAIGTAPTAVATQEGLVAFIHMAAADLLSGIDLNGNALFGSSLPAAKMGGGFWIGHTADGTAPGVTNMRPGHYIIFNNVVGAVAAASTTGITTTQAAQVDRKLDDGIPQTGDVQATGQDCVNTGVYAEADVTANCSLYLRTQG